MAVKNEKTMFMRWEGSDFIMHGVFVGDPAHTSHIAEIDCLSLKLFMNIHRILKILKVTS
jgi:hypothetical protein